MGISYDIKLSVVFMLILKVHPNSTTLQYLYLTGDISDETRKNINSTTSILDYSHIPSKIMDFFNQSDKIILKRRYFH